MTANKQSLRRYIRYQLAQMSALNGHHLFEQLSFDIAKLRIASNIIPATGPVQVGGDQGRDFETFRSYIVNSNIANNTFLALVSEQLIVFGCSLNKKIQSKIKADLEIIFGSTSNPLEVCYFCESDMPVSKRHALENHCRKTYNATLQIFDGQAIAELLSDSDAFWIAEAHLSVPSEMFPDVVGDKDYNHLSDYWLNQSRTIDNYADFLEIKRALRRATFEPVLRPDLDKWMGYMRLAGEIPELVRKSQYELAVANLRGRGSLDPVKVEVTEYFESLPSQPTLSEIEDITNLATYCSTASKKGALTIDLQIIKGWFDKAEKTIDNGLAHPRPLFEKYQLLVMKGQFQFQKLLWGLDLAPKGMVYWNEAMDLAVKHPLCDVSSLANLLGIVAPFISKLHGFDELVDRIDGIVANREGAAAAGDYALTRAMSFAKNGQYVKAIDHLHKAQLGWFAAESMRGSVIATITLAVWYNNLNLPLAARFNAMAAMYVATRMNDEEAASLAVHAGFAIAETFYKAGEGLTFLITVGVLLQVQASVMSDPFNFERYPHLSRACSYACIVMALLGRLAPETLDTAQQIVRSWWIDEETKNDIIGSVAFSVWKDMSREDIEQHLKNQLGQNLTNDLSRQYESKWAALGVDWRVSSPWNLIAIAEQLASMLQIVLVDISSLDLLLIPSSVEIRIVPSTSIRWNLSQKPDNGDLVWELTVSADQECKTSQHKFDADDQNMQCFTAVISILNQLSAMPESEFLSLIEARLKGLMTKAFWVRPAAELMSEARDLSKGEHPMPMPVLSTKQLAIPPLCANELSWRSDITELYSAEQGLQFLQNRYRRMMAFAKRAVPLAMSDPKVRGLLTELHQSGMLDWQILSILFNICLNDRLMRRLGQVLINQEEGSLTKEQSEELKKVQKEELEKLEAGTESELDLSSINAERVEFQRKIQIMAVLNTWGLENRRITPNFDSIKQLLDERFHMSDDDIPHEDIFGWTSLWDIP